MDKDKLKKSRTRIRASVTKLFKEIKDELSLASPDKLTIRLKLATMEAKVKKMTEIDQQILSAILEEETTTDDDYLNESKGIDEYEEKLIECRLLIQDIIEKDYLQNHQSNKSHSEHGDYDSGSKRKFQLPKLELVKFGGELKEWLGFWSVFKKIDKDNDIDDGDKFQYLLQAMKVGTKAREIVEGYPATSENYPKAIETLKKRFGRDDLLVEVYVRELLRLVLCNAHDSKNKSLSSLFDQLESHIRALDTLGVTDDKCASMLFPLVESCLPEDVLRAWQRSPVPPSSTDGSSTTSPSKLTTLMNFLRIEVEGEERIRLAQTGFGIDSKVSVKSNTKKRETQDIPTSAALFTGQGQSQQTSNSQKPKALKCIFCDKAHASTECHTAHKWKIDDKKSCVMKKRGCLSCLKIGHKAADCKSYSKCLVCSRKHATIMCPDNNNSKNESDKQGNIEEASTKSHAMTSVSCSPGVALQTLTVKIQNKGKEMLVRAIIDTASQRSYILERTASEISVVPTGEEKIIHVVFGGSQSKPTPHRRYEIQLMNISNDYICSVEMLDQSRICQNIPCIPLGTWMEELNQKGVKLTDDRARSSEIEILLGADIAGKLLTGKVKQLQTGLTAIETKLGWTLLGQIPGGTSSTYNSLLVTSLLSCEATLADLWKLESIGIHDSGESKSRAVLEEAAKDHFLKTVKVNEERRYEVILPWIEGHPNLPNNYFAAERRLESCTRKLVSTGKTANYQKVFDEWLEEEVIEKVSKDEVRENSHFLPHRAVIKETSSTTKVRPVFDASAKEKSFPSLNDCLEKGPNLIELIPSTIMRFRLKRIGVIADIKKAFLQIAVSKRDCDFLLFLWWEDLNKKKIVTYRHRRVVFGATSSPFLLAAVLDYHLKRATDHLLQTSLQLLEAFYVDNCVTSVENELQLVRFISEATDVMAMGMFDLRGWEHTWLTEAKEEENEEAPLLGMLWNKKDDRLRCDLREMSTFLQGPVTKRKILSVAHKIFDPVGFTCPVSLFPKILLQETWKLKLGWDAELPSEIAEKFLWWSRDLKRLEEIKIPRWLGGSDPVKENWSIHTFTDASKVSYAACVYLRIEKEERVEVQLITAKSRVAPLDKLTISRLELMSCLIGSRLTESVIKALKLKKVPTYYWNDSSTALYWIQKDESWASFVGNRVKEIRSLTRISEWRHVPGLSNPADLPSRGCQVSQLIKLRWWEGPHWLKYPASEWPKSEVQWNEEEVNSEKKKTVTSMLNGNENSKLYSRKFSKYQSIIRMVAWMLRFKNNAMTKVPGIKGSLTVQEINVAEERLLFVVQSEAFSSETDRELKSLAVFRDQHGLLRVKTSIERREDLRNFKFPILLPSRHPLVDLLMRDVHLNNSHAGVSALRYLLRENYWILKARNSVKSFVSSCIRCQRYEVKSLDSVPISLPCDRVTDADIFEVVGVDLAGSLYLKGRIKAWVVLFTCAVYRAVHFELVTSISTEAFLQSFRRFIGRRGRPCIVYSDNGTNFVGANNLFSQIDWNKIESFSTAQRIQWKFNPPSAAWWGGWWERIVRMLKNILKRVLGKASVDYEGLSTILCDSEALVNSRPLTYISEDIHELTPLSPSVFLHEKREVGVPDIDMVDRSSMQKKYKRQQELMEHFRSRFRSEYLSQLTQKTSFKNIEKIAAVGDIVLIGRDDQKRLDWPLGKIIEIIPGKDGNVRVVRVKTARGELLRPVQRIFPLEVTQPGDPIRDWTEIEADKNMTKPGNVAEQKQESVVSSPFESVSNPKKQPLRVPQTPPSKVLRTRCGREVKVPVKFESTLMSFCGD